MYFAGETSTGALLLGPKTVRLCLVSTVKNERVRVGEI